MTATAPVRARFARDEFGHKYVAVYRWDWPYAPRVAHVVHFDRHPDEDTSREYTEGERRELCL